MSNVVSGPAPTEIKQVERGNSDEQGSGPSTFAYWSLESIPRKISAIKCPNSCVIIKNGPISMLIKNIDIIFMN